MSTDLLQIKLDRYLAYLAQDKNNPHLLRTTGLLKAEILHHQQHLSEAIHVLEALLVHHESCAELKGLLSLLYFDNQDVVQATLFSQQALLLDPKNYAAQLVQILLQALENNASLDEVNALLEIQPLDSRLWFVLGTTQMRHMNYPAATQAFIQTTTIHPSFYDSWICSGWCYLLQNDLENAKLSYQHAIKIDPEAADGWGGSAVVHALQNRMTEAKIELEKAELLDSTCFLASLTRIIIANQSSPEEGATQFNAIFPNIAPEINQILTQALIFL